MVVESTDGVGMRYQLEWLGRLVEDRVDGITEDGVMGLATESGGSGELFR